jgi:hypothetical protein
VVLLVDVSGSVFQQGVEVAVDAAVKVYEFVSHLNYLLIWFSEKSK